MYMGKVVVWTIIGLMFMGITLMVAALIYWHTTLKYDDLFGMDHFLSDQELLEITEKERIVDSQYTSVVAAAVEARDASLCEQLPSQGSHFTGYAVQTSGGPLWPHYSDWQPKGFCHQVVILEIRDPDLCNRFGGEYTGKCLSELGIQLRYEGDNDVSDICELIENSIVKDWCYNQEARDLKTNYLERYKE